MVGEPLVRMVEEPGAHGRLAVEHRPTDVVAQPLIVKHELANRVR
jgi:hypothetical protein